MFSGQAVRGERVGVPGWLRIRVWWWVRGFGSCGHAGAAGTGRGGKQGGMLGGCRESVMHYLQAERLAALQQWVGRPSRAPTGALPASCVTCKGLVLRALSVQDCGME